MGVIGGAGGYASIAPIQGNPIGEAMQSVENMDIKRRNERLSQAKLQQEADQANQARLDKRNSMMQSFTDKHPGAKDIGIQQPDAILHQGVEEGRQQYIDAQSILSNPNSTLSQRSKAYATSQNVSNSFDQMADFSKKLTEVMDAARENKGGVFNPNGVKESLNNNEKFKSGQWKLNRAKNGTINVDTFDVDTNGKFTVPTGVGLSPQELLQKYTPPLNYSSENNDTEFKKALPPLSEWESKDGKQVYKGYQGIEQYAKDNAESVVTNRDKMYGIAAAAGVTPQMDLKDYHPEEIKKIKDFIINGFTEKYKAVPLSNYKKLELDNKIKQQNIDNGISSANLKVSQANSASTIQARTDEKNTDKKSTQTSIPNAIGIKFKKDWIKANPDATWNDYMYPTQGIDKITTSSSTVKKGSGSQNPTPKTTVKTTVQTQDQWNTSWGKLKRGEKLVGLDGKTYTKN